MKNTMRKIFSLIILTLGFMVAFATVNAQDVELNDELEAVLTVDTVYNDPLFEANPYMYINAYSNPWAKTKQLQYSYDAFNNVWDYQGKFYKQLAIGSGVGLVAITGMVYAVNMPTPTRQVNNPALDKEADEAQRDRRIVGAASIGLGIIAGVIVWDSFKWQKRIRAEVGLQSLRLQYNLTGERSYFQGKKVKKLKKLGLYPRYKR